MKNNNYSKQTLVILAAGMGSRFGGLKQIEPFGPNGETLLEYSVYDALQTGFGSVLFVISAGIESYFKDGFLKRFPSGVSVDFVVQDIKELPSGPDQNLTIINRIKPWGTGHAVWITRNKVNEPFIVINGDDFYGREALQTMADYLKATSPELAIPEFCMLGYKLKNTLSENGSVSRGICQINPDGYLQKVEERTHINGDEAGIYYVDSSTGLKIYVNPDQIVSMNIFGFRPVFYNALESFFRKFLEEKGEDLKAELYLPGVVNQLVQESKVRVKVLPVNSSWFGVTYLNDKSKVVDNINCLVQAGIYPSPLWIN